MSKIFKSIFLLIVSLLISGCGDKIVKMNEYKDIKYSYQPHSNYGFENKTYEDILDDNKTNKKIKFLSEKVEKKIEKTINNISTNQSNSNIMNTRQQAIKTEKKNHLFYDRFDSLRLQ